MGKLTYRNIFGIILSYKIKRRVAMTFSLPPDMAKEYENLAKKRG